MPRINCVWWNVSNLYPWAAGASEPYRPASRAEYDNKLNGIVSVLSGMKGGPPNLLFLGEVAIPDPSLGTSALTDLVLRLGGKYHYYQPSHGDNRSISCAAVWTEPISLKSHQEEDVPNASGDLLGRPIVMLDFDTGGGQSFTACLNHWTSRVPWAGTADCPKGGTRCSNCGWCPGSDSRSTMAQRMVGLVQQRVCTSVAPSADPQAIVVVVGDFNDEPFDASLTDPTGQRAQLAISKDRTHVLGRAAGADLPVLYNPSWALLAEPQNRNDEILSAQYLPPGGLYHNGWWCTLDQVMVTAGAIGNPPVFVEDSLRYHADQQLSLQPDGSLSGWPSDHLPLCFELDL